MRNTKLTLAAAVAAGSLLWSGTTLAQDRPIRPGEVPQAPVAQDGVRPAPQPAPQPDAGITTDDTSTADRNVDSDTNRRQVRPPLIRDPNLPAQRPGLDVGQTDIGGTGQVGTITGDVVGAEPRSDTVGSTGTTPLNNAGQQPAGSARQDTTLQPSDDAAIDDPTDSATSAGATVGPRRDPGSIDAGSGITGPGITAPPVDANATGADVSANPNDAGAVGGTTSVDRPADNTLDPDNRNIVGGDRPNTPRIDASDASNNPPQPINPPPQGNVGTGNVGTGNVGTGNVGTGNVGTNVGATGAGTADAPPAPGTGGTTGTTGGR